MNTRIIAFTLALAACALVGCSTYSKASKQRVSYTSDTPAGQSIARAQKQPSGQPLAQLGAYLDAVSSASSALAAQPGDTVARADYNFAVGRIFEVIHDAKLEPWKAPLTCPGATQEWIFAMKSDERPERNPANYSLLPADRYSFEGRLVVKQDDKEGLGAPLVL